MKAGLTASKEVILDLNGCTYWQSLGFILSIAESPTLPFSNVFALICCLALEKKKVWARFLFLKQPLFHYVPALALKTHKWTGWELRADVKSCIEEDISMHNNRVYWPYQTQKTTFSNPECQVAPSFISDEGTTDTDFFFPVENLPILGKLCQELVNGICNYRAGWPEWNSLGLLTWLKTCCCCFNWALICALWDLQFRGLTLQFSPMGWSPQLDYTCSVFWLNRTA